MHATLRCQLCFSLPTVMLGVSFSNLMPQKLTCMFCVYMGTGAEEKQWLLNEHVESALGSAFQAGTGTVHSPSVYCGAMRPLKGHGKCNQKGLDVQS